MGCKFFLFDFIGKGQSFLCIQLDVLSCSQPAAIRCLQNGRVTSQESLTSAFHLAAGGLALSSGALICEKWQLPAFFHFIEVVDCVRLVARAQLCSDPIQLTLVGLITLIRQIGFVLRYKFQFHSNHACVWAFLEPVFHQWLESSWRICFSGTAVMTQTVVLGCYTDPQC